MLLHIQALLKVEITAAVEPEAFALAPVHKIQNPQGRTLSAMQTWSVLCCSSEAGRVGTGYGWGASQFCPCPLLFGGLRSFGGFHAYSAEDNLESAEPDWHHHI